MNEVFIAVPRTVTLEMIGDILGRTWTLDQDLAQPSVDLGLPGYAYVAEVDPKSLEDPLLLQPDERDELGRRIGDYRLFTLRYSSRTLGRDMARAIASSELAQSPMLLDLDDRFVTPSEFLNRTRADDSHDE